MPPKKTKTEPTTSDQIDLLEKEMQAAKLDFVRLTEDIEDRNVECVTTGFPAFDLILRPTNGGIPRGRDVEIFSKNPETGKTTLTLQIAVAWQRAGMRVMYADVENTMTAAYLETLGMVLEKEEARQKGVYPLYWFKNRDKETGLPLAAEMILNTIRSASQIFDLIIVDSVSAMESEGNLQKASDENNQMGGISKLLSEHFRKNVSKRAAIIWINQMRMFMGYNPTGITKYITPGGKALSFYASVRLLLDQIDKIKTGVGAQEQIVGTKVQVFTEKNKIGPQYKKVVLTQLMGQGFSQEFDYFDTAVKLGVVVKSGGWFSFGDWKVQGQMNFVEAMQNDPELMNQIKAAVDGEPVDDTDQSLPTPGQEEGEAA